MSVTLVSQPPETIAAANCPVYTLELDSAGTPPITNSIGYEFYVAGEKLAGLEEIPYTGEPEQFNPAKILKAQVGATLLGYTANSVTVDSAAVKQYYLRYGQMQFNEETCDKMVALGNQSADRWAVNANFPWYIDQSVIDSGAPVVLTERPARVQIYSGQRDWLHIWRKSGPVGVRFQGYDGDGNLIRRSSANASFNKQVRIYPVGPGNGFFPWSNEIAYYDIDVFDSPVLDPDLNFFEGSDIGDFPISVQALVWTCRFIVAKCESASAPDDEIYFEEPMGGYSGIKFLEVQGRASASSQRYIQGVPCGTSYPGAGLGYGQSRHNLKSYSGAQMRTEIPYEAGIDRWLHAFFSAKNHYRKFLLPSGGYAYEKMLLADGSYNILNNRENIVLDAIFDSHLSRA